MTSIAGATSGESAIKPKTVEIIQARLASSRLPRKVVALLAGRTMLEQQSFRLRYCRKIDEIVLATTVGAIDDELEALAQTIGITSYRGSETDVLGRYCEAAVESSAGIVVRVTADCPLIDPEVVDRVATVMIDHSHELDYISNTVERTFPRGLDVEAMPMDVLSRMNRMAHSQQARKHVTHFLLRERSDLFVAGSVRNEGESAADMRWTVDEEADLRLVRVLYEELRISERRVPWEEIRDFVRRRPELMQINAHVVQKHL